MSFGLVLLLKPFVVEFDCPWEGGQREREITGMYQLWEKMLPQRRRGDKGGAFGRGQKPFWKPPNPTLTPLVTRVLRPSSQQMPLKLEDAQDASESCSPTPCIQRVRSIISASDLPKSSHQHRTHRDLLPNDPTGEAPLTPGTAITPWEGP